jgi:hypothetical protein
MNNTNQLLFLNAVTGAPWWENTSSPVRPMNTLTLSGSPGANISISLSNLAFFNETGTRLWQDNLDENGRAILHVYSLSPGLVNISAYITTNPTITATASMRFGNYLPGAGLLLGYAVTTGAASNGMSQASVYLEAAVSSAITQARVEITQGSATLVGHLLPAANIALYPDGTSTIDITDITTETVALTISLPQAAGSTVTATSMFVDFPGYNIVINDYQEY